MSDITVVQRIQRIEVEPVSQVVSVLSIGRPGPQGPVGLFVFATTAARDAAIPSPYDGQTVVTADTNTTWQYVDSAWVAVGRAGTWNTWAPTWSGITLGASTVTARYERKGRSIEWFIKVVLGAGFSITAIPGFTLPVAPATHYTVNTVMGQVSAYDVSANATHFGALVRTPVASVVIMANQASPAAGYGATVPFTFAVPDELAARGTYEAAA